MSSNKKNGRPEGIPAPVHEQNPDYQCALKACRQAGLKGEDTARIERAAHDGRLIGSLRAATIMKKGGQTVKATLWLIERTRSYPTNVLAVLAHAVTNIDAVNHAEQAYKALRSFPSDFRVPIPSEPQAGVDINDGDSLYRCAAESCLKAGFGREQVAAMCRVAGRGLAVAALHAALVMRKSKRSDQEILMTIALGSARDAATLSILAIMCADMRAFTLAMQIYDNELVDLE